MTLGCVVMTVCRSKKYSAEFVSSWFALVTETERVKMFEQVWLSSELQAAPMERMLLAEVRLSKVSSVAPSGQLFSST